MQQRVLAERITNLIEASMAAAAAAANAYAYASEPSALETPGQFAQQHYSQPASYAPSQPTQPSQAAPVEDANPLGRRKSVAPANENETPTAAGAKHKAGYEATEKPAAKKGKTANPFARR
jgi:chromosome transmission fidelity protein 4